MLPQKKTQKWEPRKLLINYDPGLLSLPDYPLYMAKFLTGNFSRFQVKFLSVSQKIEWA